MCRILNWVMLANPIYLALVALVLLIAGTVGAVVWS